MIQDFQWQICELINFVDAASRATESVENDLIVEYVNRRFKFDVTKHKSYSFQRVTEVPKATVYRSLGFGLSPVCTFFHSCSNSFARLRNVA